jgi:hypothetical protein
MRFLGVEGNPICGKFSSWICMMEACASQSLTVLQPILPGMGLRQAVCPILYSLFRSLVGFG